MRYPDQWLTAVTVLDDGDDPASLIRQQLAAACLAHGLQPPYCPPPDVNLDALFNTIMRSGAVVVYAREWAESRADDARKYLVAQGAYAAKYHYVPTIIVARTGQVASLVPAALPAEPYHERFGVVEFDNPTRPNVAAALRHSLGHLFSRRHLDQIDYRGLWPVRHYDVCRRMLDHMFGKQHGSLAGSTTVSPQWDQIIDQDTWHRLARPELGGDSSAILRRFAGTVATRQPDIQRARAEAERVRRIEGYNQPPIPIERLAKKYGAVQYCPLPNDISGRLRLVGSSTVAVVIDIAEDEGPARQHFTLAHELGHAFLSAASATADEVCVAARGTGDNRRRAGRPEEYEADAFAAALLMPPDMVRKLFPKSVMRWRDQEKRSGPALTDAVIADLAKTFEVSHAAMKIQLEDLHLLQRPQ